MTNNKRLTTLTTLSLVMEYRKLSTATKTRDPLSSGIVIQLLGGALRPTQLQNSW